MIEAEHIERAERLLVQTYRIGTGDFKIVMDRARVDKDALDKFVNHHSTILFKKYMPEIDPRHEAAIRTMFVHFFAIGAIAQRASEGRS